MRSTEDILNEILTLADGEEIETDNPVFTKIRHLIVEAKKTIEPLPRDVVMTLYVTGYGLNNPELFCRMPNGKSIGVYVMEGSLPDARECLKECLTRR